MNNESRYVARFILSIDNVEHEIDLSQIFLRDNKGMYSKSASDFIRDSNEIMQKIHVYCLGIKSDLQSLKDELNDLKNHLGIKTKKMKVGDNEKG